MFDPLKERIISIIRENAVLQEVIPTPLRPSPPDPLPGPVKAVMFDVYGTLFISASGDIGSMEQGQSRRIDVLLHQYGVKKTAAHIQKDFVAEVENQHRRLKEQGFDFPEVLYEEIWAKVLGIKDMDLLKTFAVSYEMIVNPVYPMPHLEEVLPVLKEKKLKMGIISNAQFFTPYLFPAFLEGDLEELGFDTDLLFYSYRGGYAKPSDYMYRQAGEVLKRKGIEPGQVVYMGNDMLKDILPAQKAGFKTILFAGDRRSLRMRQTDERCRGIVPDRIKTHLKTLPLIIRA